VDIGPPLIPDAQAPELMQPGKGPFDHPAEDAQSATVGRAPLSQDRDDAPRPQGLPVRGRIVGPVALDPLRSLPRVTNLPADRGDRLGVASRRGDWPP